MPKKITTSAEAATFLTEIGYDHEWTTERLIKAAHHLDSLEVEIVCDFLHRWGKSLEAEGRLLEEAKEGRR